MRIARPGVTLAVVVACAVYLPQIVWPNAPLYTGLLAPHRLLLLGSIAKLACIAAGAAWGLRIHLHLAPTNPARRPWGLLALWMALWFFAQGVLGFYSVVLQVHVPVPSVADLAFYVGFGALYAAQVDFIRVYRRSGFPIGSARSHAVTAIATAAVLAVVVLPVLIPMVRAGGTTAGGVVLVSYPALDLVAVVPAVVLLRVALAFRPGRVWEVWTSLAVGLVLMAIGDVVTIYLWPGEGVTFDPAIHLAYFLAYLFSALGLKLQWELVAPR